MAEPSTSLDNTVQTLVEMIDQRAERMQTWAEHTLDHVQTIKNKYPKGLHLEAEQHAAIMEDLGKIMAEARQDKIQALPSSYVKHLKNYLTSAQEQGIEAPGSLFCV